MNRIWLCFLFSIASGFAYAQDTLSEFHIVDSLRKPLVSGFHQHVDLTELPVSSMSLADVLASYTGFYFKTNGPGLLATSTYRGGDANHTQVVWEGFQINSPMLGSSDFSTFGATQFTSVDVVSANSSNLYSTGGIGGSVILNSSADFNAHSGVVTLSQSSFGNTSADVSLNHPIQIGRRKLVFKLNSSLMANQNRFSYINNVDSANTWEVRDGAQQDVRQLSIQVEGMLSDYSRTKLVYWLSNQERDIANALGDDGAVPHQRDLAHRAALSHIWQRTEKLALEAALFTESNSNQYKDTDIGVDNDNRFESVQFRAGVKWKPKTWLELGQEGNARHIGADSKNYDVPVTEFSGASVTRLKVSTKENRLVAEAGTRVQFQHDNQSVLPFGGVSIHLFKGVSLITSASKNLRYPTVNERYWNPGGNTQLKPEEGWLIESGIKHASDKLDLQAIGFYGETTNRIRWLPQGAIFSPVNIAQTLSRGADLSFRLHHKFGGVFCKAFTNLHYTQALSSSASSSQQFQLSYIPEWSGVMGVSTSWKQLAFSYRQVYYGKRYLDSGETAFLPHFTIGTADITYGLSLTQKLNGSLALLVDNIWDWHYQNLPWMPMPGRSFTIKFAVQW